jgi:hypothetical protein
MYAQRLAVAAHTTQGGPSRGTEFMNAKWANDLHGVRNLKVVNGLMFFHATYTKQRSNGHGHGIAVKYFAPRVTRLFIKYLLLIRPMEIYWSRLVFQKADVRALYQTHMFVASGSLMTSESLSKALHSATVLHMEIALKLSSYRQCSKVILRYLDIHQDLDEPGEDDGGGQHSTAVSAVDAQYGQRHYAPMTSGFDFVSADCLEVNEAFSRRYHNFLGLGDPAYSAIMAEPAVVMPDAVMDPSEVRVPDGAAAYLSRVSFVLV